MSQRLATYDADGGRCVGCGRSLPRSGSIWSWHVHHVVKQQTLRRRGVPAARLRDATFTVLVCKRCHERHESAIGPRGSATGRIPFAKLPRRVVEVVDALGPWAQDALRRYHPSRT